MIQYFLLAIGFAIFTGSLSMLARFAKLESISWLALFVYSACSGVGFVMVARSILELLK